MKHGIKSVGIVGLGLMGGSFGRALVKRGYKVYAFDKDQDALLKGELMLAYGEVLTEKNAKDVDLLIAAVNPAVFESAISPFLPHLKSGAIVSDFCGVKRPIVSAMEKLKDKYKNLVFIGGHPMAGREFSGIEHSSINLFEKASMILVPVKSDIFKTEELKNFYLSMDFGRVVITDAVHHDEVIAYTSQLCHIVSNAFIKNEQAKNRSGYSAGSFKDLTRVARMNPDMWTELILLNADNALTEIDELINNLSLYKKAIEDKDGNTLRTLFKEGNDRKIKIESEKNADD